MSMAIIGPLQRSCYDRASVRPVVLERFRKSCFRTQPFSEVQIQRVSVRVGYGEDSLGVLGRSDDVREPRR